MKNAASEDLINYNSDDESANYKGPFVSSKFRFRLQLEQAFFLSKDWKPRSDSFLSDNVWQTFSN